MSTSSDTILLEIAHSTHKGSDSESTVSIDSISPCILNLNTSQELNYKGIDALITSNLTAKPPVLPYTNPSKEEEIFLQGCF